MDTKEYKILILEDVPTDAELMERELQKGGLAFVSKRVVAREDFSNALDAFAPDLILSDYKLPQFDGLSALGIAKEKCPGTPFIFVTGAMGDELAVETLKQGAVDYVLKDKLLHLVPAVERAFRNIASIAKEKEIDKAKTEFVSLASHQLRTPLTAISWYTEMILHGDVGSIIPKQQKYLEEIYQGNKRMVELVNTLLDVSRLELGTFATKPELVQLKNIAESVLTELQPEIITKKIAFDKYYDPSLPMISADPQLTRMIFQNLLENAVKYVSVNGKISFNISIQNSNILIKVWNDGAGIPKEAQPKIFTKLFRDDLAKQKEPDGNGLGLYIVKSIVEKNDGKVWFESEEDKGTTFYVTLPLGGMKNLPKVDRSPAGKENTT